MPMIGPRYAQDVRRVCPSYAKEILGICLGLFLIYNAFGNLEFDSNNFKTLIIGLKSTKKPVLLSNNNYKTLHIPKICTSHNILALTSLYI